MKKVLRIFNIILCGISALAIILIFTTPIFKFQLKSVNGEMVANLLSSADSGSGGGGAAAAADSSESSTPDMKEIVEKYVKDENGNYKVFKFKDISIKLTMSTVGEVTKAEPEDRVKVLYDGVFSPLISGIVNDPTLKQIIRDVAKETAKTAAKGTLSDEILKRLVDDDTKTNEYLEAAGINDEFIGGQIDNLFEALFPEDSEAVVTVSSVAEAVVGVLSETMDLLNEAANSEDPEIAAAYSMFAEGGEAYLSDEQLEEFKEEIETELGNMLQEFALADEEGNVASMDEALAMLLEGILDPDADNPIADLINGKDSGGDEGEKASLVLYHYAEPGEEETPETSEVVSSSEEVPSEEEKEEEDKLTKLLSNKLWELICSNIFGVDPNKDTSGMSEAEVAEYKAKLVSAGNTVGEVCKYARLAMFAFAGLWALLFLVSFIRIFAKNKPYKYMGFFYWFFLVLFGIIELVFGALLFAPALLSISAISNLLGDAAKIISMIGISLYSSLSATWVLNTVLFFFSIAYAVIGHKVKKQYKIEKRAKKLAAAE